MTEAREPHLFAFLYRLSDELGAPRPYRVFLSARVNACVFYDLSLINLVWPSKKNLEIGLGLINILTIGEFKAVLAHEFGHFAQRSMAVGRWVYTAQQIAAHIVSKRDALDGMLDRGSRLDIRLAWVAWILKAIIWAIRALVEVMFTGVFLAHRALSREMEFQADLVAVSVTGSDAIVHALHRLGAADDAWSQALSMTERLSQQGRFSDPCSLQQDFLARLRTIFADPAYGARPDRACDGPGGRIFRTSVSAPPLMWSTHPSNSDREENAKSTYVPCDIDDRESWLLFSDRAAVTASVLGAVGITCEGEVVAATELEELAGRLYGKVSYDRRYRGIYLGRSCALHSASMSDMVGPTDRADPMLSWDSLYPPELAAVVEHRRALQGELVALYRLKYAGSVVGAKIQHRGREVSRRALATVIADVETELKTVEAKLDSHDRRVRTYHRTAAIRVGEGWFAYLEQTMALLHYASHARADLADARDSYQRTLRRELSKPKLNSEGIGNILEAATRVHVALSAVHGNAAHVLLDDPLAERLGIQDWASHLGELRLGQPTGDNIAEWVKVVDGWVDSAVASLDALEEGSLDGLLVSEERIHDAASSGRILDPAPEGPAVPSSYPVFMPGSARKDPGAKEHDSFSEWSAKIGKIAAAVAIIGAVIMIASSAGHVTVVVLNGFARDVNVELNGRRTHVAAFGHQSVDVRDADSLSIRTTTADGRVIESFDTKPTGRGVTDLYNIAGAAVLVEWTAIYGNAQKVPARHLGAPRWVNSRQDVRLENPPKSIQTKGGGGTRTVLTAFAAEAPEEVLGALEGSSMDDPKEAIRLIGLHLKWDPEESSAGRAWRTFLADVRDRSQ